MKLFKKALKDNTTKGDETMKAVTGEIKEVIPSEKKVTFGVKASRLAHKAAFETKKASPYLLVAGGAAGLVATSYLAFGTKEKLDALKKDHESERAQYVAEMEDEEHPMDNEELIETLDRMYLINVVRATIVPVSLGIASIAAIGFGMRGFYKRTQALTTALAGATAELATRHEKMVEQYGEEEAAKFEDELTYEEREDKNGEKLDVKVSGDKPTPFGEWFDTSTEFTSDDLPYNKTFVQTVNDKILNKQFRNGYILLNDLRDELGFERTRTGSYMGWGPTDDITLEVRAIAELDEETQEFHTRQFVSWTKPTPIYDMVDYSQANGFGL